MMVKEVIGMRAQDEVVAVAMEGGVIVLISDLLAQCTGHDLVLTMVAQ
jgi:hypothetical protein